MPTANMEEIIPAARLLSRATALTHSDYERAKGAFLSGMEASGMAAQVGRGDPSLSLLTCIELIIGSRYCRPSAHNLSGDNLAEAHSGKLEGA